MEPGEDKADVDVKRSALYDLDSFVAGNLDPFRREELARSAVLMLKLALWKC